MAEEIGLQSVELGGDEERESLESPFQISERKWSHVSEVHDAALIVCTGPSAELGRWQKELPRLIERGVAVIAVNKAINWIEACQYWTTIDPGPYIRPLMRRKRSGVKYYAGIPSDYGRPWARYRCHRSSEEPGIDYLRRVSPKIIPEDRSAIMSGNSSLGALSVAIHMRARKIGFIGLDATAGRYAHDRRAGRINYRSLKHLPFVYSKLSPQLASKGIEVVNGCLSSKVVSFPKMTSDQLVEWIKSHV